MYDNKHCWRSNDAMLRAYYYLIWLPNASVSDNRLAWWMRVWSASIERWAKWAAMAQVAAFVEVNVGPASVVNLWRAARPHELARAGNFFHIGLNALKLNPLATNTQLAAWTLDSLTLVNFFSANLSHSSCNHNQRPTAAVDLDMILALRSTMLGGHSAQSSIYIEPLATTISYHDHLTGKSSHKSLKSIGRK